MLRCGAAAWTPLQSSQPSSSGASTTGNTYPEMKYPSIIVLESLVLWYNIFQKLFSQCQGAQGSQHPAVTSGEGRNQCIQSVIAVLDHSRLFKEREWAATSKNHFAKSNQHSSVFFSPSKMLKHCPGFTSNVHWEPCCHSNTLLYFQAAPIFCSHVETCSPEQETFKLLGGVGNGKGFLSMWEQEDKEYTEGRSILWYWVSTGGVEQKYP